MQKKCQNDERKRSFFKVIINQRRATCIQSRYSSRQAAVHIPFVLSIGFCSFCCLYDKKNITHWFKDLNFMLVRQKQYLTSERSERVRFFFFCHENMKLVSLSHCEMFSCNLCVIFEPPSNIVYLNLMWIKRALAAI